MIAVDTNILVYAHREDALRHDRARQALRDLVAGGRRWAVPWPCVHEFLAIVTHQRVYRPPTTPAAAAASIEALVASSRLVLLGETEHHLTILGELLSSSGVTGAKVHDARVAAICLGHEIDELWTADRDFGYFPGLRTRNPLVS